MMFTTPLPDAVPEDVAHALFTPGNLALCHGHLCRIVRVWKWEDALFAIVHYLDGYQPYPVAGRSGGTEEAPLWESRVVDGSVVRSGGDYYNDADWYTEAGLRPAVYGPRPEPVCDCPDGVDYPWDCANCPLHGQDALAECDAIQQSEIAAENGWLVAAESGGWADDPRGN